MDENEARAKTVFDNANRANQAIMRMMTINEMLNRSQCPREDNRDLVLTGYSYLKAELTIALIDTIIECAEETGSDFGEIIAVMSLRTINQVAEEGKKLETLVKQYQIREKAANEKADKVNAAMNPPPHY